MTIRSTIRSAIHPYIDAIGKIVAITMAITVVFIVSAPAFMAVGIRAGISAWWNEKPVWKTMVATTLHEVCNYYGGFPQPEVEEGEPLV